MIRLCQEGRLEVRERMRGGDGAVTIRHLFERPDFQANVRLCALLTLPPGAGIGPHRHDQEDELYYVVAGSGLLEEGGESRRVGAGDAVLTGRGASHAIRNDGAEPLEILAVIVCSA